MQDGNLLSFLMMMVQFLKWYVLDSNVSDTVKLVCIGILKVDFPSVNFMASRAFC